MGNHLPLAGAKHIRTPARFRRLQRARGHLVLAFEDPARFGRRAPFPRRRLFSQTTPEKVQPPQPTAHGVPCRRNSEDQLRAITGNAFGISVDGKQPKQTNRENAQGRHKVYKEVILTIPPVVFTSSATTCSDSCLSAHTRLSLNTY